MVNSETMPDMNSSVNHKKRGEGKGKKKVNIHTYKLFQ